MSFVSAYTSIESVASVVADRSGRLAGGAGFIILDGMCEGGTHPFLF